MSDFVNEVQESGLTQVYRGLVVDVDDPRNQGRVRVYVYGVMRPVLNPLYPISGSQYSQGSSGASNTTIPALQETSPYVLDMDDGGNSNPYPLNGGPLNYIPWAEIAGYGGRHKGDVPRYAIGDRVLVMFEYGSVHLPIVLAGWLTGATATIPSLCPEQRVIDYVYNPATIPASGSMGASGALNVQFPDSFKNWIRADEAGNSMEFCGIPYEWWMRLRAGGAEGVFSGNDNFFAINTECGVVLSSSLVMLDAVSAMTLSAPILVLETKQGGSSSSGSSSSAAGLAYLAMLSHWGMDLFAYDWLGIGQYLDQAATGSSSGDWHQTRAVLVAPQHLVLGAINSWIGSDVDAGGGYQNEAALPNVLELHDTETVELAATQYIRMVACNSSSSGSGENGVIGLYASGPMELLSDWSVWMGQCTATATICDGSPYTPQEGDVLIAAKNNLVLSAGAAIIALGLEQGRLVHLSCDNPTTGNGGVSGTLFYATYVYTATDYDTGVILGHGLSPLYRRPYPGGTTPAVIGQVRRSACATGGSGSISSGSSGGWTLVTCDEQFDNFLCTP